MLIWMLVAKLWVIALGRSLWRGTKTLDEFEKISRSELYKTTNGLSPDQYKSISAFAHVELDDLLVKHREEDRAMLRRLEAIRLASQAHKARHALEIKQHAEKWTKKLRGE